MRRPWLLRRIDHNANARREVVAGLRNNIPSLRPMNGVWQIDGRIPSLIPQQAAHVERAASRRREGHNAPNLRWRIHCRQLRYTAAKTMAGDVDCTAQAPDLLLNLLEVRVEWRVANAARIPSEVEDPIPQFTKART